jgi:membrane protease YdiL (CAAX protease family)
MERSYISPLIAILVVVLTFICSLFLAAFSFILFGYYLTIVLGELFLIVIPLGYMLYKKVDVKKYVGLKIEFKVVLLGIVFGILLLLVNVIVSSLLVSIFGVSETVEESNKLILDMSSSAEGLLLMAVALSLGGLCEEFTFRGFLQTAINSKYSFGVALLASSIVFGFFHFDPQGVYMISAFVIGLFLGYIYHRWHSYVISAVAHSTLNLAVLAVLLLVK